MNLAEQIAPASRATANRRYTLADIVRRDLVTVGEDESVEHASGVLRRALVSGAGVRDRKDDLCGVVSLSDIAQASDRTQPVKAVMTPVVFSVDICTPVALTARLMADSKLHRLFVEEEGRVIGIVTLTDIARLVGQVGLAQEVAPAEGVALSSVIRVDRPREVFIQSLERCGNSLAPAFYRRFMDSSEEVRRRFAATDMKAQEEKLGKTLRLAADVIVGDSDALAKLKKRAEQHSKRRLDIRPDLYPLWMEALIAAVYECDTKADRAVEHAWRLLMGHVVDRMVRDYDP